VVHSWIIRLGIGMVTSSTWCRVHRGEDIIIKCREKAVVLHRGRESRHPETLRRIGRLSLGQSAGAPGGIKQKIEIIRALYRALS
jgi:hypothetical protein